MVFSPFLIDIRTNQNIAGYTLFTLGTLYEISSLFFHFRKRTIRSHCNKAINKKRSAMPNLKLILWFTLELDDLHVNSIRSMELVMKTKLRRLSFHDKCGSFRQILLYFLGIQTWIRGQCKKIIMLRVLPFNDWNISRDGFDYYLNSVSENVDMNDWDIFWKRGMLFMRIKMSSLLPKIDKVRAYC